MTELSLYSAITDFYALRWQRELMIAGDAPDARNCSCFYFMSYVHRCYCCFKYIEFENGRTFFMPKTLDASSGRLDDGTLAYLFRASNVRPLLERWQHTSALLGWLAGAPFGSACVVLELVVQTGGASDRSYWYSPGGLRQVLERHLVNVGLPDLRDILDLVGVSPTAMPGRKTETAA